MTGHYDAIVVGGGHNGLVCAAYLARAGLTVCVLERHERIGGAAITEEFHPGFRNSAASYTVSLLQAKVIDELELGRHGLEILPRPLDNFVPALEGPGLELPGDLAARCAAIAVHSRSDAARYPAFVDDLGSITQLVKPLLLEPPVDPTRGPGEWRRGLARAARLAPLGPRRWRAASSLVRGSAGHWLDRHFETDLLKGGLGFDSVVGHYASPYSPGSGYLLLHHALGEVAGSGGSWGHAVGGMGAISEAIAAAARSYGAEIRVAHPVARIDRERGRFVVDGPRGALTAEIVAAGVHPRTLFLELVGALQLPAPFRQRIERWRSESASFRLNVALSELPDFRCLPGLGRHHGAGILLTPSLDELDAAYRDAARDGFSAAPIVELLIPSTLDPTLAPAGAHVASLFCQHFRRHLPDGRSWHDAKPAAIDAVIERVDRYAPNFRRSIIAIQAYSPEDLETRFGLVGGDIFHGVMSLDQLYWRRPAWRYAQYRTPIDGLYLCASGAHPGGGVSGAPGHNAAAVIAADFRARRDRQAAVTRR
jgi:phytoene dehydrogenase-like protein